MFIPRYCPHEGCASNRASGPPFAFHTCGRYLRACDGHWIQRYRCNRCRRSFSRQTFRGNYRWRKPFLHHQLIPLLCSKVTRRQAARVLGVHRKTVEHRFLRISRILRDWHQARLEDAVDAGGLRGVFQLDEAESFEHHRRLKPVTVAVMLERTSYFVLDVRAAPLAPRRPLREGEAERLAEIEAQEGRRRSGSWGIVRDCLRGLDRVLAPGAPFLFESDEKVSYAVEARRVTQGRRPLVHRTTSSRNRRDRSNLLFPINHTLAMMRDGMSCLVRRSWAAAKKRLGLLRHAWIWRAWRNYVRGVTGRTRTTPAQALGVVEEACSAADLMRSRWPLRDRPTRSSRRGP